MELSTTSSKKLFLVSLFRFFKFATMRWLQKSSQVPQLLGLSPLKVDDESLTKSTNAIDLIEQRNELMTNLQQNQSVRKSRKGKNCHIS